MLFRLARCSSHFSPIQSRSERARASERAGEEGGRARAGAREREDEKRESSTHEEGIVRKTEPGRQKG